MLWISCKFGDAIRSSGLKAGADMSTDEPRLGGVLPDMADVTGLTFAWGSFTVVTALDGSSLVLESILALTSGDEPVGRPSRLDGVCEKKRGENGPSRFVVGTAGRDAAGGISNRLGGEAPVRGFLKDAGSIAASCSWESKE